MRKVCTWLLTALIFSIPWENALMLTGVGTIAKTIGIVTTAAAVVCISIERKMRKVGLELIIAGLLLFWMLMTSFWSIRPDLTYARALTFAQILIMVWLLWEFVRLGPERERVLRAYVLGCWVAIVGTVITYISGSSEYYGRAVMRGFDPNDLGLIIASGIPIAWYIGTRNSALVSWLFRLYPAFGLIAIVLTASRGALISAAFAVPYIVLTLPRVNLRSKIALLCLGLGLAVLAPNYLPESSMARLSTIGLQIATRDLNSRVDIWRVALDLFADAPIGGLGAGALPAGMSMVTGVYAVAHNTYISILAELGIVGLVLYLILGISLVSKVSRLSPFLRGMWGTWMLVVAVGVMALSWEDRKALWFLIGLTATCRPGALNDPCQSSAVSCFSSRNEQKTLVSAV